MRAPFLLLLLLSLPALGKAQRVELNGVSLYYEVEGSGPPLLLVHGGGSDGRRFDVLGPLLAKRFTVIRPDCRGRGRSTDSDAALTYEAMAKDLVALLDHLKVRRAHVVGWSDGGVLGLVLAITFPERVDRVVSFGANFSPEGLRPETAAYARALTAKVLLPPPEADPAHWPKVVEKVRALWLNQPRLTRAQLATIRAPVLIAAADRDAIRLEHTVQLFQAIPRAQLLILPGAGHSLKSQPLWLVERAVTEFLAAPAPKEPAAR